MTNNNILAIDFDEEWIPLIQNGGKTQTIRKWKKPHAKTGQELYLVTTRERFGSPIRLIGVATCLHIDQIRITKTSILCSESKVTDADAEHIAQIDGFENVKKMRNYIVKKYGDLPFDGYRILWSEFEKATRQALSGLPPVNE